MWITVLASWIVVGFSLVWLLALLLMIRYRFLEERLHTDWENEAKIIKSQPIPMPYIEGRLKSLDKEFQPQLSALNRKKQFLRDIFPFMKQ